MSRLEGKAQDISNKKYLHRKPRDTDQAQVDPLEVHIQKMSDGTNSGAEQVSARTIQRIDHDTWLELAECSRECRVCLF